MGENRRSFPEIVVGKYISKSIETIYYNYKGFDWNRSKNGVLLEYDMYIPSLRLAIEYDGEYFHGEDRLEKDIRKNELAKQHYINLLRIREENAPEISGEVIRTNHQYTLESFEDLFNDISKWFDENYALELRKMNIVEINNIMAETKKEIRDKDIRIDKFCKDYEEYCTQTGNKAIGKNSFYTDENGQVRNISNRYYHLRQEKAQGYLTEEQISKIAAVCPQFMEEDARSVSQRNDEKWYRYFYAYSEYIKDHRNNPNDDKTKEYNGVSYRDLMDWISDQKTELRNNKIQSRIDELNAVDPNFFVDKRYTHFDEVLAVYKKYIAETGSSQINVKTEYDGIKLGAWVAQQAKDLTPYLPEYLEGKLANDLAAYKISALIATVPEKEGFFMSPSERRWNDKYNLFKTVYENFVSGNYAKENRENSWKWAQMQKKYYKEGKIKETDLKYARLTAINPNFFADNEPIFPDKKEDSWNAKFEKYKTWCKEHDTFIVPMTEKEIFDFVGDVKDARNEYGDNASKLWKERFAKVLSFNPDFFLTKAEIQANNWINLYKEYIHEKGTLYITSTTEYKGQKLGGRITKDMSNFVNKKEKFDPSLKAYLPEIEQEYLALVPNFCMEGTYGVVTHPTAEQKEMLAIAGKTEKDAPTKEYADYYLHKIDEQRIPAGEQSLFDMVKGDTVKLPESPDIPTTEEISSFCNQITNIADNIWPSIRIVCTGQAIATLQAAIARSGIYIEEDNNRFIVKNSNNPLLLCPVIDTDCNDKKELKAVSKHLVNDAKKTIYENLNNELTATVDADNKLHKVTVDTLHAFDKGITLQDFRNICNKYDYHKFDNTQYDSPKQITDDIVKEKNHLSERKKQIKSTMTEFRISQKYDPVVQQATNKKTLKR